MRFYGSVCVLYSIVSVYPSGGKLLGVRYAILKLIFIGDKNIVRNVDNLQHWAMVGYLFVEKTSREGCETHLESHSRPINYPAATQRKLSHIS